MDEMDSPNVGDLAVWNVVNPPRNPYLFPVDTPEEAKEMIEKLADAQLVTKAIVVNAFGLVEWDGEEWTEWGSEEGEDIDEWESGEKIAGSEE
jgi:hypothetical protein